MPIIRPLTPLILGTILGHNIHLPNFTFILIILAIYFLILIIISKINNYPTRGILAAIIWFAIGAIHADLRKPETFTFFRENASMVVSVDEQINPNDQILKVRAKLWQINDTAVGDKNWFILLSIKKDSLTQIPGYGQVLYFKANLNETKNRGNPFEFDYKNYLTRKRVMAQSFINNNEFVFLSGFSGSKIQKWAYQARSFLLNQYHEHNINGQNMAVLSALTLGYQEDIDLETKQQFSGTGATHILSVSGLHVGILYMMIAGFFQFIFGSRFTILRFLILILAVWTFAVLSGSSPSVLRSALMFSFVAIATSFQRETNMYNTIFLSAFFLILYNPVIIYDIGFQLSYMALLSIIWLVPIIESWWEPQNKWIKKLWSLIAVSIAAQLGTSPIALYYFHQFPNYFFLTNIAVVPLSGIILGIAIIFLIISFIPYLSDIVAQILDFSVSLLRGIIGTIDALPYSNTQFIPFNFEQIFLAYALILGIFMFIQHKYYYLLKTSLIFALFFAASILFQKTTNYYENKFVIYNTAPNSVYQIVSGSKSEFYSTINDSTGFFYTQQMIQSFAMHSRAKIQNNSAIFNSSTESPFQIIKLGNKKILILKDDFLDKKEAKNTLEVDYIVLNNSTDISLEKLSKMFRFKSLIIDSSVSNYKRNAWTKEATEYKIRYHDVKTQGAFMLNF